MQMVTLAKATELEGVKRGLAEVRVRQTIELDKIDKVGKAQNDGEALTISSAASAAAADREAAVELKNLRARVEAFKDQMGALQPELVSTLKVLGDQQLATELTKNLSPLAILGGKSVAEVAERLLKSLPIGITVGNGNGGGEAETKAVLRKKTETKK